MNDAERQPPLRIAFYGYAEPHAGSVSSAGHVILSELLSRGHQIDFFGKRSFAYPAALIGRDGFRFRDTESAAERRLERVAKLGPLRQVVGPLLVRQTRRNVPRAMAAAHRAEPYDVCLYLGTWAFGRTPGLPTVSWVQGAPGSDARSIARHAGLIRRCDGVARYALLRTFAVYRQTFGRPQFKYTDVAISGSSWSAGLLRQIVGRSPRVASIAYPIDLQRFSPAPDSHVVSPSAPVVLWAGRIVPRKRLDLFLAACERLLADGRHFEVRIVGGFGFAPGFRRLIDEFRFPDRLRYDPTVPRTAMPDIYRSAAVMVQASEEEDFGSSVAEALACGTPVVVGPTNGTGDYVCDGGDTFEAYTPSSLAAAIDRVLHGNRKAWRTRARVDAEHAFDVRRITDRLEAVLRTANRPSEATSSHAPDAADANPAHLNRAVGRAS